MSRVLLVISRYKQLTTYNGYLVPKGICILKANSTCFKGHKLGGGILIITQFGGGDIWSGSFIRKKASECEQMKTTLLLK